MENKTESRRTFIKMLGLFSTGALLPETTGLAKTTPWKIAIHWDTTNKSLGSHGLETAFYGLPNIEIVAHIDANSKDIEKRMEITHAKRHYSTLDAMFKEVIPDIIVLTSRHPNDHLNQIRQAAEKGCHLYCEKPLVASLQDADKIVEIVKKHHIKLTVAHPRRYDLGYITMKRLLESGKIGTPMTIQGWSKNDHRGGGEDMLVLGSHIFDLFIYLFGVPLSVSSEVYIQDKPFTNQPLTKTVEPIGPTAGDDIFATFRFKNGVHGIYESRSKIYSKGDYPMGIGVMGSKGMLSMHFSDAKPDRQPLRFDSLPSASRDNHFSEEIELKEDRIIPGAVPIMESFKDKKSIVLGPVFATARRYAVLDLMQAIEEDRQPICNVFDAQTVMEMIYGVYASHLQNKPVLFPLTDRKHPLEKFLQR